MTGDLSKILNHSWKCDELNQIIDSKSKKKETKENVDTNFFFIQKM